MAGLSQIYADGFARDLIPRSTAPTFLSSTSYAVGDYVYYQGSLYRCTTAHTGTWVASHFTAVTVGSELKAKEASLQSEIDDVKSDLSVLDDNIRSGVFNMYDKNDIVLNKFYRSDGTLTNDTDMFITNPIKLQNGYVMTYSGLTKIYTSPRAVYFDSTGTFISGSAFKALAGTNVLTNIPPNAVSIAFSIDKTDIDTFSFSYSLTENTDKQLANIEKMTQGFEVVTDTWQKGELSGLSVVSSTKRVINPTAVIETRDVYIHLYDQSAFHYYVVLLNADQSARTQESGWITEDYYVPKNTPYYVIIEKQVAETVTDVSAYSSQIAKSTQVKFDSTISAEQQRLNGFSSVSLRYSFRCVNHMGYHVDAPENTLSAFKISKTQGYDLVESDIRFTSDGVPVLLHDATINRTGRNLDGTEISTTINIADITYEQALNYDFGIYKGEEYSCKLPTFEEYIVLCKRLNLFPYIEIKQGSGFDTTLCQTMLDILDKHDMRGNVTWISFGLSLLRIVRDKDEHARLGVLKDSATNAIYGCSLLKTGCNDVFVDMSVAYADDTIIAECEQYDLPVELYTIDSADVLKDVNDYISGVTTNILKANEVFYS